LRILSFTFADGRVSLPIGVVRYIILVMLLGLQKKGTMDAFLLGGIAILLAKV